MILHLLPLPCFPHRYVRDLWKAYGAVQAACGVPFEVAPGEIFGLLGPNGAGKITTVECMLGLRQPDRLRP